mmetsp:Transcript_27972/g.34510  ORF Transcript_27972/g.34510 Transcript_27972/m.34510 type:complete len:939 (+) Transcript_27972:202-3018(+)
MNSYNHSPTLLNKSGGAFFVQKLGFAMKVVKTILDTTRNPAIATPDEPHTYDDKFTLVEYMTNCAASSTLNVLEKMGLDESKLKDLIEIVAVDKKAVSVKFVGTKGKCTLEKEDEVEIEYPVIEEKVGTVEQAVGAGNEESPSKSSSSTTTTMRKLITKVKQYHWTVEFEYNIYVYTGTDDDSQMKVDTHGKQTSKVLMSNCISVPIVTKVKTPPVSSSDFHTNVEDSTLSLTWLLQNLDKETLNASFAIDREKDSCRTPRNNMDALEAWIFYESMADWCHFIINHLNSMEASVIPHYDHILKSVNGNSIFVPVLPIFESVTDRDSQSPILTKEDVNLFFDEQRRTMTSEIERVVSNITSSSLITSKEATIKLLMDHLNSVVKLWAHGVDYIEDMLYTQLYNAIGKHIQSDDVNEYVKFRNQKIFSSTYAPEPFCYAIRRLGCSPDGLISIEEADEKNNNHAMTFTRQLETSKGQYPMFIPINSATSVQFNGNLFLHAWMLQRFQDKPKFHFTSRARQFSSFILLIGKLAGADNFEPEHGIILQNKDEVLIPLMLDEIPSAKEFKDAIGSLSPEQQQFAKAIRSMKLSSSVFGVCVIQLKPQLEMLLGLPERSLTKEIRLTEDLLSLFIDYQIPSDLLAFDGTDDLGPCDKVEVVKGYVKNVQDMINSAKEKDLNEAKKKADMAFEKRRQHSACPTGTTAAFGSSASTLFGAPKLQLKRRSGCPPPAPSAAFASSAFTSSAAADFGEDENMESAHESINESNTKSSVNNDSKDKTKSTKSSDLNNLELNLDRSHTDITNIPKILDAKFEAFSLHEKYDGVLRSTMIKTSETWTKKSKPNLLTELKAGILSVDEQKIERNKAFDLLDALSRGGVLPLLHSELHIIIACSHCFDKSVVNTVVQDNVNPIEKIERSNLLMASTIHDVDIRELRNESVGLNQ